MLCYVPTALLHILSHKNIKQPLIIRSLETLRSKSLNILLAKISFFVIYHFGLKHLKSEKCSDFFNAVIVICLIFYFILTILI